MKKTVWGMILGCCSQDNRQSLVLVKLEELEERRLTKEMKYLVSSLTYLAWPPIGRDTRFVVLVAKCNDPKMIN